MLNLCLKKMADDATDLSALLGNAPVQSPSFAPMVTGGGDPFIAPISQRPAATLTNYNHTFSTIRYAIKNLMTYFGFFLAVVIVSLSTPRSLILQYIPNTYTSGGIVSYMGAAILGGVAVVLAYVAATLLNTLI